jgi:hypothetical protein
VGSAAGKVIDNGGYFIPDATVEIMAPESSVCLRAWVTGKDGSFRFPEIGQGRYRVRISKKGFDTLHVIIRVESGKDRDLELTMSLSN